MQEYNIHMQYAIENLFICFFTEYVEAGLSVYAAPASTLEGPPSN